MPRLLLLLTLLFTTVTSALAADNPLTGTLLVANRNGGSISLIDLASKSEITRLPIGPVIPHEMTASPDGRWAVTGEYGSGTLSVIWLNEERPPTVIPTGARAEGIAVSPDGNQIWVANQGDSTITVVDADSLEVIDTIEGIATNRVEFLPNGTAVIPGGSSADNSARVVTFFAGDSREVARRVELPGSAGFGTGVRLLAANNALFMADSALNEITALVPSTSTAPEAIVNNPDNIDGMAWSPLRVDLPGN